MKVTVISPIRLLRESIAAGLETMEPKPQIETTASVAALFQCVPGEQPDVTVIDVTLGVDRQEIGLLAAKWSGMRLLALGLQERSEEVVQYGRAGFIGYIAREAEMADLHDAIKDAVAGRLRCPAEITCGMIRALSGRNQEAPATVDPSLTRREADVLRMLGHGFSNKEIARELDISLGTIKSHMHHIFGKLGVARRAQAMRQVRATPWIAHCLALELYVNFCI